MLTITTPDGTTLSAETEVLLANKWGEFQEGDDWYGKSPFDDHQAMNAAIEDLDLMRRGTFPNYTITES